MFSLLSRDYMRVFSFGLKDVIEMCYAHSLSTRAPVLFLLVLLFIRSTKRCP